MEDEDGQNDSIDSISCNSIPSKEIPVGNVCETIISKIKEEVDNTLGQSQFAYERTEPDSKRQKLSNRFHVDNSLNQKGIELKFSPERTVKHNTESFKYKNKYKEKPFCSNIKPGLDSDYNSKETTDAKCNVEKIASLNLDYKSQSCADSYQKSVKLSEQEDLYGVSSCKLQKKLYLCSECETYFENWNLFLHMINKHERHICLYCLGMFGQAERLSNHLIKKHQVPEIHCSSVEDFYYRLNNSCHLICCKCEKTFSENDNFYNHSCDCELTKKTINKLDLKSEQCILESSFEKNNSHNMSGVSKIGIQKIPAIDTNTRRLSKRIIKPNRLDNMDDVFLYTNLRNSRTRKTSDRSVPIEKQLQVGQERNSENEIKSKSFTKKKTFQMNDSIARIGTSFPDVNLIECSINKIIQNNSFQDNDIPHIDHDWKESSILQDMDSLASQIGGFQNEINNHEEKEIIQRELEVSSKKKIDVEELENENMSENLTTLSSVNQNSNKNSDATKVMHSCVTPTSDRSLVIKIVTKKETGYSVSTSFIKENNDHLDSPVNQDKVVEKISQMQNNDNFNEKMISPEAEVNDRQNLDLVNSSESLDSPMSVQSDLAVNCENINLDNQNKESDNDLILAGNDIIPIDLHVEDLLESIKIEKLLRLCIKAVSMSCIYCNHARHIAVNAKQLSIHMLAEHRFQPQHPAVIMNEDQFLKKVKAGLINLDDQFLNLETYDSTDIDNKYIEKIVFECFHCRFYSTTHKELYLHNRKMHQKAILICIMCKSTFHGYSELLCHLCPGVYDLNNDIRYHCCFCTISSIPSAFRLMVHLRKSHHVCEVCLEWTGDQQSLSNHVWKHKLNHSCYRCSIAYRNKPDITKHLFWKHGTESVLCKKCLQKKWPHVYHFCIPPNAFICEECGKSFSKAIYLKVHKRLHTNIYPYSCLECSEKVISKKLLKKHELVHNVSSSSMVPQSIANLSKTSNSLDQISVTMSSPIASAEQGCHNEVIVQRNQTETQEINVINQEPVKSDVYGLPPLNLSDSDSENEPNFDKALSKTNLNENGDQMQISNKEYKDKKVQDSSAQNIIHGENIVDVVRNEDEKKKEEQIMGGIWNNFKSYTATLNNEVRESIMPNDTTCTPHKTDSEIEKLLKHQISIEHDYCTVYSKSIEDSSNSTNKEDNASPEIDPSEKLLLSSENQNSPQKDDTPKIETSVETLQLQDKQSSSTDSSSDSGSSSCSCGSNCSCSNSQSSSSSSSINSDSGDDTTLKSPKKSKILTKKRKTPKEGRESNDNQNISLDNNFDIMNFTGTNAAEIKIEESLKKPRESDLETTETESDEDFYDVDPRQYKQKINSCKDENTSAPQSDKNSEEIVQNNTINNESTKHSDTLSQSKPDSFSDTFYGATQFKEVGIRKYRKGTKKKNLPSNHDSYKISIHRSGKYIHKKKQNINQFTNAASTSQSFNTNQHNENQSSIKNTLSANQDVQNAKKHISDSNTRSSKRRRIPKKFYDDSSDEDNYKKQMLKWRRTDILPQNNDLQMRLNENVSINEQSSQFSKMNALQGQFESDQFYSNKKTMLKEQYEPQTKENTTTHHNNQIPVFQGFGIDPKPTNSKSVLKDCKISSPELENPYAIKLNNRERQKKLYCYCQCPYDDVSEMIACDGDNCQIEWFHFKCVGIAIPPKGKWFCPDCQKIETDEK